MRAFDDYLTLALVAIAGGLGSVLRFLASSWSGKLPWGILTANVAASFLVGLFAGYPFFDSSPSQESLEVWLVVITVVSIGFAGGLSTFSSYAAQTVELLRNRRFVWAGINTLANLLLSATAVYLGLTLATTLLK